MVKPKTTKSHDHLYSKAEIEALFASIGEGLIVIDDTGKVTRVNKRALDMLGFRRADLLGKRFIDKMIAVYENGTPLNVIDRPIGKAFLTGDIVTEKIIYKRPDGTLLPVQLTVSPLIMRGRPTGAVQLFRDITAEVRMDRMMSDFISLASHQLRTPLTSINIYTGMLLAGLGGKLTEQQKSYLEIILTSSHRMNELIDTLLSISRIEAGGLQINTAELDTSAVVNDITSEIMPQAAKKDIAFTVKINSAVSRLETDELLLKEILANLLTNAVKYTPNGGKVTLIVKALKDKMMFKVVDTGYGIPAHLHSQIFNKFFRADNILTHDVSGTGLGLYLAKMISDRLGGDLWFESVESEGTTFTFSIPKTATLPSRR